MYNHDPSDPAPCICGFSDLALVLYVVAGCAVVLTLAMVVVLAVRPHRYDLLLGGAVAVAAVWTGAIAWRYWGVYAATFAPAFPSEVVPGPRLPPPLGRYVNNQPAYLPYVVLVLTVGALVLVGWRLVWRWWAFDFRE